MALSLTALASELTTDPNLYGYAALIANGNDSGLAALLNTVRTGADGFLAIQVRKTDISTADLVEQINIADLPASPTQAQLTYLQMISNIPNLQLIDEAGTNTRILGQLLALFSGNTRTRINALSKRFGSRAEELFGSGIVITDLDIARALRPVALKG